jgi:hypothetical protein
MEIALARIELIARQLCRNAGYDADQEWIMVERNYKPMVLGEMNVFSVGIASRSPAWHAFTGAARDVLQLIDEYDAPAGAFKGASAPSAAPLEM